MEVREVTDKKQWESFVIHFPIETTPFFQSWDWGEVQKNIGNWITRLGIFEKKRLVGVCLVVEIKAKRGHYLHLRHGPLISDFLTQLDSIFEYIKTLGSEKKVDFIRMSPFINESVVNIAFLKKRGFRDAPIHNMDAENAWVLDLDISEEELLKNMRKTTRYLVRKSLQLPIKVERSSNHNEFNEFMKLYNQTSKRHKFAPHRGLLEEIKIFSKQDLARLYTARYEGTVIAGAMIVYYGNQAVYHHGASSDIHKDIPAAYLLQWEAIKEAKKLGKKIYNFWGVVPEDKLNHPWRGLTLFKTGFGGRRINFIHAQDFPSSLHYWKTYLIETATKKLKGY